MSDLVSVFCTSVCNFHFLIV